MPFSSRSYSIIRSLYLQVLQTLLSRTVAPSLLANTRALSTTTSQLRRSYLLPSTYRQIGKQSSKTNSSKATFVSTAITTRTTRLVCYILLPLYITQKFIQAIATLLLNSLQEPNYLYQIVSRTNTLQRGGGAYLISQQKPLLYSYSKGRTNSKL